MKERKASLRLFMEREILHTIREKRILIKILRLLISTGTLLSMLRQQRAWKAEEI